MNDATTRPAQVEILEVLRWIRGRHKKTETQAALESRLFHIGEGLDQLFDVVRQWDESGDADEIWRYSSMLYDMFRELHEEWQTARCQNPEMAEFPPAWKTTWEVLAVVGVTEEKWLENREVQRTLDDVFA